MWVLDQGLRRLLPVTPAGTLGNVVGLTTAGAAGLWQARGPDAVWVNTLGNAYAAIRLGGFTAASAVLCRYRPGVSADTLVRVRRPEIRELEGTGTGRTFREVLFCPEDAWSVTPDGRIAVVRAEPYQVEWI